MYFTKQMHAVIEAIWVLRCKYGGGTDLIQLKNTEVERAASEILKRRTSENEMFGKIKRQNWYNHNAKKEWKAIRRSINGETPLVGQTQVETEIAKFDAVDTAKLLSDEIFNLKSELKKYRKIISGHEQEFEEFRSKTYATQYLDLKYQHEYQSYKEQFENIQIEVGKEKKLRQNYQSQTKMLRKKRDDLKRILSRQDNNHHNATPLYKDLSPCVDRLEQALIAEMYKNYQSLKDAAWEEMVARVRRQKPDTVFLIFHQFNCDLQQYIDNKVPLVSGSLNFVYGCFEPFSMRRKKMYQTVSSLLSIPPHVIIVNGFESVQNVVELDVTKRKKQDQLCEYVASLTRGIEFYDVLEEGFKILTIERVDEQEY